MISRNPAALSTLAMSAIDPGCAKTPMLFCKVEFLSPVGAQTKTTGVRNDRYEGTREKTIPSISHRSAFSHRLDPMAQAYPTRPVRFIVRSAMWPGLRQRPPPDAESDGVERLLHSP
jgi:hypothetical protein